MVPLKSRQQQISDFPTFALSIQSYQKWSLQEDILLSMTDCEISMQPYKLEGVDSYVYLRTKSAVENKIHNDKNIFLNEMILQMESRFMMMTP